MQSHDTANRKQETAMRVARAVTGLSAMAAMLVLAGCRQDMHDQPKFFPQRGTSFYADGRSVRPQVENTVARNQLHQDAYFFTGLQDGKEGDGLPIPLTTEVMQRGQERYNIYCTPCHSRVGNGDGMIVQRGYRPAGDFHTDRLRNAPLGHFFNVISNGYGAMPDYASQISVEDRWAIVAYVRALQLSQNAKQTDVASGSHVEPLTEIEEREGFAPDFAADWGLPSTAVYGTPNHEDYVLPGNGSAPATSGPAAAPAAKAPTKTAPTAAPAETAPAK